MVFQAARRIVISGHFTDTADFDPGIGVVEHTANGTDDVFVSILGL